MNSNRYRLNRDRLKGFLSRLLFIMLISGLLFACSSSEDEELSSYIYQIKKRAGKAIEPIPEFELPPKYAYPEDVVRRSPFKPIIIERQSEETFSPNTDRPKQPLEAFPLDALKFVGILKEGRMIWGLVSQPDGLVTRVKPGDYMGKNFGLILGIDDNGIKLQETVQVSGKWEKQETTLTLNSSAKKQD